MAKHPSTEVVDEKDERAIAGMKELERRLMGYFAVPFPRAMNDASIRDLQRIVDDFRVWFKNRYGITFPFLVPFVLPSTGHVRFVRADWDHASIQRHLLFTIDLHQKTGRPVAAVELAQAVRRAWPTYKPPDPAELTTNDKETVQ